MANPELDDDLELTRLLTSCSAQERPLVFQRIYDRYSSSLFRYLFRFTGDAPTAEEILHDIFVQLLDEKFKETPGGTLKAWLFAVAKNRGLNHLKRASTRAALSSPRDSGLQIIDRRTDLEGHIIAKNLLSQLAHHESNLPQDLKETWELRKQGLDYQEIATALAIPVGTVKSRFSRLVELMRTEFRHEK